MPIGELIIGTIAFLIVFFVLGKLLLPKISKALEEREQTIEGGLKRRQKRLRPNPHVLLLRTKMSSRRHAKRPPVFAPRHKQSVPTSSRRPARRL